MAQALFGPIQQLGYVVADLDESVQRWTDHLGVGPWTVFRNVKLEGRYRGQPTVVTMDVALGYQGEMQIELIEATNASSSPYRADDGTALKGLHHVAWMVDDLDASVAAAEARGLKTVFTAGNEASRVAYMEAPGEEGHLYELIESASTAELLKQGILATRSWDGVSNPITVFDFAAAGEQA